MLSAESLNTGKFHVGPIPSTVLMGGPSLTSFLPGLFTCSGPAYFGVNPGLGIERATVNIGVKTPIPGAIGLEITAAPTALVSNGISFLNGNTTITGTCQTVGADTSAGVTAVAGAQAEASSKGNASNIAVAGQVTASVCKSALGSFASVSAPFKQFNITHPTRDGYRLVHASLEGPEMGVYFRGRTNLKTINLPDYWDGLVDKSSITVQLTPIGKACSTLHVKKIVDNVIHVGHQAQKLEYFYIIHGERKDIGKLVVEYEGQTDQDFKKSRKKYFGNGERRIDKYSHLTLQEQLDA